MQMRVKMQQPAYKCQKMQMRALFVNGPIPGYGLYKIRIRICFLRNSVQESVGKLSSTILVSMYKLFCLCAA